MTRTSCGSCGADGLEVILDLGDSPLADAFPTDPTVPERRYPLQLLVCRRCWLVQLGEVVPDEKLWSDYGFYSSTSPAVVAYHRELAAMLLDRHRPTTVVEVACNDGSLLSELGRRGARTMGIDPASGPAGAARERGLIVEVAPFGLDAARKIRGSFQQVDLVVACNVAAHVASLGDLLSGICHLMHADSVAVLEVQSLAALLLGNQFDHVYHEHRYYFSPASLGAACERAGLVVTKWECTPMQGGSLRLTCRRGHSVGKVGGAYPSSAITTSMESLAGVQARAGHLRRRLLDLLGDEIEAGRKVAGFAASAKSTTLLNWCGIGPDAVSHVVDTTPHKIGRFTPGTHIPIVAPGDRPDPDTYLMLAWNYLSRIRSDPFPGRWLVPIPQPVIL